MTITIDAWIVLVPFLALVWFNVWIVSLKIRLRRKLTARQLAAHLEAGGDGDVFVPHTCGPLCQECKDEGYPDWICFWLI